MISENPESLEKPASPQSLIWNSYVCDDCFPYLAQIPDASVDLIFTSPADLSQVPSIKDNNVENYRSFQLRFLREASRIVTPTGYVIFSQTNRKLNGSVLSQSVYYTQKMMELGFELKTEKIIPRNEVGKFDMFHFTYQHFMAFSKEGKQPMIGADQTDLSIFRRDIIVDQQRDVVKGQKTWSLSFCRGIIKAFGQTINKDLTKLTLIDPFAAAGPTLYVANELGMKWWGAEIEPHKYNEGFKLFTEADKTLDITHLNQQMSAFFRNMKGNA